MRAVTSGDIRLLARYIAGVRREDRAAVALRIIEHAHVADRYRKRTGRAHRFWGDGSLAAALPRGAWRDAEPLVADRRHLQAIADALDAILSWKDRQICPRRVFAAREWDYVGPI